MHSQRDCVTDYSYNYLDLYKNNVSSNQYLFSPLFESKKWIGNFPGLL